MQANCPQCGQTVAVDDARAPEKPFGVKCPKCQSVVRFPGRAGAPEPPAPGAGASPAGAPEELRAQMMAQLRREMHVEPGQAGRALVALPDRNAASAASLTLTRLGFGVDTLEDWEEGARLLEQGVYTLVVTARAAGAAGKRESLYQRLNRLSPDARRRLFVLLVGDEFRSGDGTQAFVSLGDLVLTGADLVTGDLLIGNTMQERKRLYQAYLDARRRQDAD